MPVMATKDEVNLESDFGILKSSGRYVVRYTTSVDGGGTDVV